MHGNGGWRAYPSGLAYILFHSVAYQLSRYSVFI
jgi:hypothetical protein